MKTNLAIVATASAALVLAGCAAPTATAPSAPVVTPVSTSTSTPTASPSTSTPTASPSPTAPKSARGNLIKKVGQPAGIKLASGEQTTSFTLTKMTVDAPCTAPYSQPSENGHFVALTFDVETTADLAKDINQFVWFGGQSWKLIADNGTTYNGSLDTGPAYGCLKDAERIPSKIGPAEKVTGTIVLDVPAASGTLVFEPSGSGGWEWSFPAK